MASLSYSHAKPKKILGSQLATTCATPGGQVLVIAFGKYITSRSTWMFCNGPETTTCTSKSVKNKQIMLGHFSQGHVGDRQGQVGYRDAYAYKNNDSCYKVVL